MQFVGCWASLCACVYRCSAAGSGPEDPAWHRPPGGGADDYFWPDQSWGPSQCPEGPAAETQVTCSKRMQQTSSSFICKRWMPCHYLTENHFQSLFDVTSVRGYDHSVTCMFSTPITCYYVMSLFCSWHLHYVWQIVTDLGFVSFVVTELIDRECFSLVWEKNLLIKNASKLCVGNTGKKKERKSVVQSAVFCLNVSNLCRFLGSKWNTGYSHF